MFGLPGFYVLSVHIVNLWVVSSDCNCMVCLSEFYYEELVGNYETCIHMPKFWYGGRLGTSVFASKPRYSYYYYSSSFFLSFFRQRFVRHISRRCLDQTLWNLVGISYAMWSCAFKFWFFQNGCRCHGNGQNAKKLKNTKMIIAGYSLNRNWWNLIGTTSTSSGTR